MHHMSLNSVHNTFCHGHVCFCNTLFICATHLCRLILAIITAIVYRGQKTALSVAKGLCFLHSKNIAHLDMKTPNILLNENLAAKIADVGLGKLVAGPGPIATQMGSPMWASPEQLQGYECGLASDIFSFGTILWEVCTGEQPRYRQTRDLEVPAEAPQAIKDLVIKCHSIDPQDRPSALEVHAILKRS